MGPVFEKGQIRVVMICDTICISMGAAFGVVRHQRCPYERCGEFDVGVYKEYALCWSHIKLRQINGG